MSLAHKEIKRFPTFNGQELNCQFDSLTLGPSFGHNLCFKCPNGSCKPIFKKIVPRAFQLYEKLLDPMSLNP